MKLAETLSIIKQKEGELTRLLDKRDSVVREEDDRLRYGAKDMSIEEYNRLQLEFNDKKSFRFLEISNQIEVLTKEIVKMKIAVNQKNVVCGIDRYLQDIKYIRIELSRIMKYVAASRGGYRDSTIDDGLREKLGIDDYIKHLESKKATLDAKIQALNWQTEL
jgi:hypothetical protein